MSKIIGVAVSCLVACSLFLTVQPAFGALQSYDGAWEYVDITADTAVTFEYSPDSNYSFGIYEYEDTSNFIVLHSGEGVAFTTMEFDDTGDTLKIDLYDSTSIGTDTPSGTLTFNQSDSNLFGFFFSWESTPEQEDLEYEYSYQTIIEGKDYQLVWPDSDPEGDDQSQHFVNVHDAKPVPIPTAMLLLSSGLVGLAGFKRKMDS